MKIGEALLKMKRKDVLRSRSLEMYDQDVTSLIFWLLEDPDSADSYKIKKHKRILKATDWEIVSVERG